MKDEINLKDKKQKEKTHVLMNYNFGMKTDSQPSN